MTSEAAAASFVTYNPALGRSRDPNVLSRSSLARTAAPVADQAAADPTIYFIEDQCEKSVEKQTAQQSAQHRRLWVAGLIVVAIVLLSGIAVATVIVLDRQPAAPWKVPKSFSVSFVATSKFNQSISYAGRFLKTENADGTWNVALASTRDLGRWNQVWTLVNNRAYVQHFEKSDSQPGSLPQSAFCVKPNELPPLQDLQALFDSATVLPAEAQIEALSPECQATDPSLRFALQWGAADLLGLDTYVLCLAADGSSGTVEGHEFTATLLREPDSTVLEKWPSTPLSASGQPKLCPVLDQTAVLQVDDMKPQSRRLPALDLSASTAHWLLKSSKTNMETVGRELAVTPTTCVFISEVWKAADEYVGGDLRRSTAWSGIGGRIGGKCTSVLFVNANFQAGWEQSNLRNCGAYINSINQRMFVFAHGAAGIALLLVYHHVLCTFPSGSQFYMIGGMIGGTPFASTMSVVCPGSTTAVYANALSALGACETISGVVRPSKYMDTLKPEFSGSLMTWQELLDFASGAIFTGIMCGTSTSGLSAPLNSELMNLADNVPMGNEVRDGQVPLSVCAVKHTMQTTYSKPYYQASVTAFDLTCRHGEAFTVNSQRPCSWVTALTSL